MARIGVILSGCGVFDGAEIHESVCTMLSLDQRGAEYRCMAPKRPFQVINHLTQAPIEGESRDVLTESARIARGEIDDLARVKGDQFDAFILPGGFGAAKNLCTFAAEGANCDVDADVERVLKEAHEAGRPIGFACIAPAVAASVFGESLHPQLTIGSDKGTAEGLEKMGARHVDCAVDDIVVDEANRIVSTPAYMTAKGPAEVFQGIDKMVDRVLAMTRAPAAV